MSTEDNEPGVLNSALNFFILVDTCPGFVKRSSVLCGMFQTLKLFVSPQPGIYRGYSVTFRKTTDFFLFFWCFNSRTHKQTNNIRCAKPPTCIIPNRQKQDTI